MTFDGAGNQTSKNGVPFAAPNALNQPTDAGITYDDDRNRFMSPDLGRFLQPDPIGFKGDASNLYRYCGNDWANRSDPTGLLETEQRAQENTDGLFNNNQTGTYAEMIDKNFNLRSNVYAPTAATVERQKNNVQWQDTGNWTDKNVNNHYLPHGDKRLAGKDGITKSDVFVVVHEDGSITVVHQVNWWVDKQRAGTDVVTRELEHEKHWADWERDGEGFETVENFVHNGQQGGATKLNAEIQGVHESEFQSQYDQFDKSGGPHDTKFFPPKPVTDQDIRNALSTF